MDPKQTKKNDSAFVIDGVHASDAMKYGTSGLSKREYIATKAMQGIVSTINQDTSIDDNMASIIVKEALLLTDKLIEGLNA